MNIKIGADPELFIQDKKTKRFVSAHEYFPGTKDQPFFVKSGAVQVDGVAAEFNINPVVSSPDFLLNISDVIGVMQKMLANQDPDLELRASPTATFTREYFDKLPDDVKTLGCSPDFNAWTEAMNQRPSTEQPFRTGAGHVHIGFIDNADITDEYFLTTCRAIVKTLDASLYVMSHSWDDDRTRRSLYGAKGAFRPKPYGLEYRVLSNAFLLSPAVMRYVFETSKHAAELVLSTNTFMYKSEIAKNYMNRNVFSADEFLAYDGFLEQEFGFDHIDPKVIIGAE